MHNVLKILQMISDCSKVNHYSTLVRPELEDPGGRPTRVQKPRNSRLGIESTNPRRLRA